MSSAKPDNAMASDDAMLEQAVSGLPQAEHIRFEDLKAWASALEKAGDVHPISWHIKRLHGIGGSEASVAVDQYMLDRGEQPEWGRHTPVDIVRDKLLRRLPDTPSVEMRRGNGVEELAIERLLEQTGAARRVDLEQKVGTFSGHVPGHPWMVGEPDLVMEMPDGAIILADIKAPNEVSTSVEPAYAAQLHHYREIMEAAGVAPDAMMLGKFSYADYAVKTVPVDYDERLVEQLREGGDSLWAHVCAGTEPDIEAGARPMPQWSELAPEEREHVSATIADAEERLVLEKLAAKEIEADINAQRERIDEALGKLGPLKGVKADALGLSIAGLRNSLVVDEQAFAKTLERLDASDRIDEAYERKAQYDGDAMARRLAELGEDPEAYRVRKLNPKKAVQTLESAGVPYAEAFGTIVEEKVSLSIGKPANAEKKATYETMENYVSETIGAMRSALFSAMDAEADAEVGADASVDAQAESRSASSTLFTSAFWPALNDDPPKTETAEAGADADAGAHFATASNDESAASEEGAADPVRRPSKSASADPLSSLFS